MYHVNIICSICKDEKESCEIMELCCRHKFCLVCLKSYVYENISPNIKCPVVKCSNNLNDKDIRNILNENDIDFYDKLIVNNLELIYTCVLPECGLQIMYENKNTQYECRNCTLFNCIACKSSHPYQSCEEFKNLDKKKATEISKDEMTKAREVISNKRTREHRNSIIEASKIDLLTNTEIFECFLCCLCISKGIGVQLRNCFHLICKKCLEHYLKNINKFPAKCPDAYCNFNVEDREIKALLSENDYHMYQKKLMDRVKPKLENYHQCQTPNCDYLCEINDQKMKTFQCPKCKNVNCLLCKAVHNKESCETYRKRMNSSDDGKTRRYIETLIEQGKCMKCPDCSNLVQKVRGCNWIQCSKCGIELCWILQMHRWGPKGRGDTSGGCKCLLNNVPCHPTCTGCIPHDEGAECCMT